MDNKNGASERLKKHTLFFSLSSFILLIPILLSVFVFSKNKTMKTSKATLLSEDAIPFITNIILVKNNSQKLILKKTLKENRVLWQGIIEDSENKKAMQFPIASKKIAQLFEATSQERTLRTVSKDCKRFANYSLDNTHAFQVIFTGLDTSKNLHTFAHLFFGSADITGQNIFFRTNAANAIYQTIHDFYPFISVNPSNWIEGLFFPSTVLQGTTIDTIKSIRFISHENSEFDTIVSNSSLEKIAKNLFLLQSNVIVSADNLQNTQLKYSVVLDLQDNTTVSFSIFKKNRDTTIFYVKPQQPQEYSYILEVSTWSVQRIKELFKHE